MILPAMMSVNHLHSRMYLNKPKSMSQITQLTTKVMMALIVCAFLIKSLMKLAHLMTSDSL